MANRGRLERQGDVRLGGNTDNGLKGLGVAGQSERLQGLSEVAARHKKIDSYACPPVLERPQQSATHFANRHTGKTVAEGFPADVLEFATCTQAQGQAVAMSYHVPNQPRSLGNGLTGDSVARVGARERSLD